jgi:aminopeptidase N
MVRRGHIGRGALARRIDAAVVLVALYGLGLCGCAGAPAQPSDASQGAPDPLPDATAHLSRHAKPSRVSLGLAFDWAQGAVDVEAEVLFVGSAQEVSFVLSDRALPVVVLVNGVSCAGRLRAAPQPPPAGALRWVIEPLPAPARSLTLRYRLAWPQQGRWQQAAARGAPWVSADWVHLPPRAAWYPIFEGARPAYSVEADLPAGLDLVAEGARIDLPASAGEVSVRYEGSQPSEGLAVFVGRWRRFERALPHRTLRVLLPADAIAAAPDLLAWGARALPLLERLVGDYPFESFTVAVHPFQTATSYPGLAILHPDLLSAPHRWQPTLAHEALHGWWGHLVFLGPGGNWMEGLVTYLAEHEWRAQQSPAAARRLRRLLMRDYQSHVHGLADRPLQHLRAHGDRAQELISYAKSALVFHMLRQMTSDRAFFGALRDLTARFRFQEATWDDLIASLETLSGERLAAFSVDWLHRGGAPSVSLTDAVDLGPSGTSDAPHSPHTLLLRIAQGRPLFSFQLPVEVQLYAGDQPFRILLDIPSEEAATLRLNLPQKPRRVCLDPGFDVFRSLNPDELEPTLSDLVADPARRPVLATSVSALSPALETAMAAALADRFDLAERFDPATPPTDDTPTLLVVDAARAVQPDALYLTPTWTLPWSDDLRPDPSTGRLRVQGQPLPPGASLMFAAARPSAPLSVLLVERADDAALALLSLDDSWPWSFSVMQNQRIIQRGLWPISPQSLCRDLLPSP